MEVTRGRWFRSATAMFVAMVVLTAGGRSNLASEVDDLCAKGKRALEQGVLTLAVEQFTEAINRDPTCVSAYLGRARAQEELCEAEAAIGDYTEVVGLSVRQLGWALARGGVHILDGRVKTAACDFRKATRLYAQCADGFLGRARIPVRFNQVQRTESDVSCAILMRPWNAESWYCRGMARFLAGRFDIAVDDVSMARKLEPSNLQVRLSLGYVLTCAGRVREAILHYDHAILLDPKMSAAYCQRGYAYLRLGEDRKAMTDFDAAIRLDPRDVRSYIGRSWLFAGSGLNDNAIADLTEAIRVEPRLAYLFRERARLFRLVGQSGKAADDGAQAQSLDALFQQPPYSLPLRRGTRTATVGGLQ